MGVSVSVQTLLVKNVRKKKKEKKKSNKSVLKNEQCSINLTDIIRHFLYACARLEECRMFTREL